MASSTTMPIASTKPKSVRLLIVKPKMCIKKNVPTIEIGIAKSGITAARQFCKKSIITKTTRSVASSIV